MILIEMERALVLLHGFTHTGASWDPVIAGLGESYRAIAPDIRGHGTASKRMPVTLEAVIDDLAAQTPERFSLAGYSMGGRIALHAALALPERVERLVLIGASPGIADPDEQAARLTEDHRLAEEIERSNIQDFVQRWSTQPLFSDQPASVRALLDRDRVRNSPRGLARALRGLGTGTLPSLWDRLVWLEMPVTLVVGERDLKFARIAKSMAASIPHAEVAMVPGAGHAVHLEASPEVAAVLVSR